MGIIVWSTEVVDTSAILLAQALDAEFNKATEIQPNSDLAKSLNNKDTSIIFYGAVSIPAEFKYNSDRMFNNPTGAKEMAKKIGVLNMLDKNNIPTVKYVVMNDETSYDTLLKKLGADFSLVTKSGMAIVGQATNRHIFASTKNIHYACKHADIAKKLRVFFGNDGTNAQILGYTLSEKRELSFHEALVQGACEEAKIHVNSLFEREILKTDMGKGYIGWTEEKSVRSPTILATEGDTAVYEKLNMAAKAAGNKICQQYKVDFFAVDIMADSKGSVSISNVTPAPSLQADAVLDIAKEYFSNLVKFGRGATKEQLIEMTKAFTDEQAAMVIKLLRKNKLLTVEE